MGVGRRSARSATGSTLRRKKKPAEGSRDLDDVRFLARKVPLDLHILKERYEKEQRPNLGNPRRKDLTIQLWTEAIEEERKKERVTTDE